MMTSQILDTSLMNKHRYDRPDRLPALTGDAFLRRRLSIDPHCWWCHRKIFNPRNHMQVPAGLVAEVDYKDEQRGRNEHNLLIVCRECKEARVCLDKVKFGERVQALRGEQPQG